MITADSGRPGDGRPGTPRPRPTPPPAPAPKPKALDPGRFWSLLVGLSLTGGFTFGALLAWVA